MKFMGGKNIVYMLIINNQSDMIIDNQSDM